MVAVAVIAIALAVIAMKRRSDRFHERAKEWGVARQMAFRALKARDAFPDTDEASATARRRQSNRVIEWCEAMQAKYVSAAQYPWLPVGVDPPQPK
jgi:hypothetical protein